MSTPLCTHNNKRRSRIITSSTFLDKLADVVSNDANSNPPQSPLEAEIERYCNFSVVITPSEQAMAKSQGALYFFKCYDRSFPLLSNLARSILAITAASVPAECLFSKAGLIETDLRN